MVASLDRWLKLHSVRICLSLVSGAIFMVATSKSLAK